MNTVGKALENVHSIVDYLYKDDVEEKIKQLTDLILIHDAEVNELKDIVTRQASELYSLKQEVKQLRGKRLI